MLGLHHDAGLFGFDFEACRRTELALETVRQPSPAIRN